MGSRMEMVMSLISVLINLLIIGLILWLIWWLVMRFLPLPEQAKNAFTIILVVIAIIYLLGLLVGYAPMVPLRLE